MHNKPVLYWWFCADKKPSQAKRRKLFFKMCSEMLSCSIKTVYGRFWKQSARCRYLMFAFKDLEKAVLSKHAFSRGPNLLLRSHTQLQWSKWGWTHLHRRVVQSPANPDVSVWHQRALCHRLHHELEPGLPWGQGFSGISFVHLSHFCPFQKLWPISCKNRCACDISLPLKVTA